jgi:heme-binding NEAT domain protein
VNTFTNTTFDECRNVSPSRDPDTAPTATTACTSTSAKKHVYHPASTTTVDTVNWDLFARKDMFADVYVPSTWLVSAPRENHVRMLTLVGRKTYPDLQCAPRKQKKSWSMSELSSGKNKSGRRSVKGNGGMNVEGVEVLGADVSAAVEGVSFLHRFFYGDIIAWHGLVASARVLGFFHL